MIYSGSVHTTESHSFIRAMLAGVDSQCGCFVPADITPLPTPFFKNIAEMSSRDVAYVVVTAMMGSDFSAEELRVLVDEWIVDGIPLTQAGKRIYALEPWAGSTMSQYDLIGRLFAMLVRKLYDRQIVSVDSVFFSPSFDDSCVAVSRAFMEIIGQSPVMLQGVGALTDVEKQQVAYTVPRDMLYVVTCDQENLSRLCCRAMINRQQVFNGGDAVMISDVNVATLVARVFSYFEAYRQLAIMGTEGRIVISPDRRNAGDMLAAKVAIQLGLPATIAEALPAGDTDAIIKEAYLSSGYMLTPRAADQWMDLNCSLADGETGVFVNQSHPAKFRSRLEPLLGRVIVLPHKLHFNDVQHVKYKRVAPSLNALKHCFINN